MHTPATIRGITPRVSLDVGEIHEVKGNKMYQVERHADHYSCTCPSWRFQKKKLPCKTCKHLKTLLGEDFEEVRLQQGEEIVEARAARHGEAGSSSSLTSSPPSSPRKSIHPPSLYTDYAPTDTDPLEYGEGSEEGLDSFQSMVSSSPPPSSSSSSASAPRTAAAKKASVGKKGKKKTGAGTGAKRSAREASPTSSEGSSPAKKVKREPTATKGGNAKGKKSAKSDA